MKLRFKIDVRAALREGRDCIQDLLEIDVHPGSIKPEDRGLIADRLVNGVDVCILMFTYRTSGMGYLYYPMEHNGHPVYILARENTIESLIEACRNDDAEIRKVTSKTS